MLSGAKHPYFLRPGDRRYGCFGLQPFDDLQPSPRFATLNEPFPILGQGDDEVAPLLRLRLGEEGAGGW